MTDLFRPQAVEFAKSRLGSPVQNMGIRSWVLVAFMFALFITAFIFISTARYARRETVLGEVMPGDGILKVSSVRSGTVTQVLVSSGAHVHKGQHLFAVSNDVTLEDGGSLATRVNAVTSQQLQSGQLQGAARKSQIVKDRSALNARRTGLEADVGALTEQKALQIKRVSLLESTVDASRKLYEQSYMSAVEFRQREDALLQARQSVAQIEQGVLQDKNQILEIVKQEESLTYQISASDAGVQLERAQVEEKRLNDLSGQGAFVAAGKDGFLTSLQSRTGDVVAAGQPLAMIVPTGSDTSMLVHLWAPSRAIGFVKPGNQVRLMFDAFPYQSFGVGSGKVVEVAAAPMMPNELPIPIETKEQMYMIVVALDKNTLDAYGRTWSLTPGMRLTADVILDRRSLLDWLMEPLIASRRRG